MHTLILPSSLLYLPAFPSIIRSSGLIFYLPVDHRCCTQAIITAVLAINDKLTLPVKHLPTISPFGIDGN
jgi:hypothetical protein